MSTVEEEIDQKVGEVRTDSLDMSFGEIMSLYTTKEFTIYPEYQRLFRWSPGQQSRFIESIMLELPIPPIFVVENLEGRFELIDGLQRITSLIRFVAHNLLESETAPQGNQPALQEALTLEECDLIPSLNGNKYEDLPLRLKLRIKRASLRLVIIRRQSTARLKYEMFKRLNTGGSLLSAQEVRNCTARMVGDSGVTFYSFIQQSAGDARFVNCISTISDNERLEKGDEELALRYFALKNAIDLFRGNVSDWLDAYMEQVILDKVLFDYEAERTQFQRLFGFIESTLGEGAFVRYRGTTPLGGLKPAFFEAVTMGFSACLDELVRLAVAKETIAETIATTLQSDDFKGFTGGGANSKLRLRGRIDVIVNALRTLI